MHTPTVNTHKQKVYDDDGNASIVEIPHVNDHLRTPFKNGSQHRQEAPGDLARACIPQCANCKVEIPRWVWRIFRKCTNCGHVR